MRFLLLLAASATVFAKDGNPPPKPCKDMNKYSCDQNKSRCEYLHKSFCNALDGDNLVDDDVYREPPYDCNLFTTAQNCRNPDNQTNGCRYDSLAAFGERCKDSTPEPTAIPTLDPTPNPTAVPTHATCENLSRTNCINYHNQDKCRWMHNAFCIDWENRMSQDGHNEDDTDASTYNCNLYKQRTQCEQQAHCQFDQNREWGIRCEDRTPNPTAIPTLDPTPAPTAAPVRIDCLTLSRTDCFSAKYSDTCEWTLEAFCNDKLLEHGRETEPYRCELFERERHCEFYEFEGVQKCMYNGDLEFGERCIDYVAPPTPTPVEAACLTLSKNNCRNEDICHWTHDSFCNYKEGQGGDQRLTAPFACNLHNQRRQCEGYKNPDDGGRMCQYDGGKPFGERCEDYVAPPTEEPTGAPTLAPTPPPVQPVCLELNKRDCDASPPCEYKLGSFCDDIANPADEPYPCNYFTRRHHCLSYTFGGDDEFMCQFDPAKSNVRERCTLIPGGPTPKPTAEPTVFVAPPTFEPTETNCDNFNKADCEAFEVEGVNVCQWSLNSFCEQIADPRPHPYNCNIILKRHDCMGYKTCEQVEDDNGILVWQCPMADQDFYGCLFERGRPHGERCFNREEPATPEPSLSPTPAPTESPTRLNCIAKKKTHCRREEFKDICTWTLDAFCDERDNPQPTPYACNLFKRRQSCTAYMPDDAPWFGVNAKCTYDGERDFGDRCQEAAEPTPEPTFAPTLSPTEPPTPSLNCREKSFNNCKKAKYEGRCVWKERSWCDFVDEDLVVEKELENGGYECKLYTKKHTCNENRNNDGHALCDYNFGLDYFDRCQPIALPTPAPTNAPIIPPTPDPTFLDCLSKTKNECRLSIYKDLCLWTKDSWCADVNNPVRDVNNIDCSWFKKHHACLAENDSDGNPLCMYDDAREWGERCIAFTPFPTMDPTLSPTPVPTELPTEQVCEGKTKVNCKALQSAGRGCTWVEDTWCEGGGFEQAKPYTCDLFLKQSPCQRNGCRYDKSRPWLQQCFLPCTPVEGGTQTEAGCGAFTKSEDCRGDDQCLWYKDA